MGSNEEVKALRLQNDELRTEMAALTNQLTHREPHTVKMLRLRLREMNSTLGQLEAERSSLVRRCAGPRPSRRLLAPAPPHSHPNLEPIPDVVSSHAQSHPLYSSPTPAGLQGDWSGGATLGAAGCHGTKHGEVPEGDTQAAAAQWLSRARDAQ